MLRRLLAHPATRGLRIDDPKVTELRKQIVRSKTFLRLIYEEWYETLLSRLPTGDGHTLEIGSGAGFLKEHAPEIIGSEVLPCSGIDLALDARYLPFGAGRLKAILMTDVFHHIPDVALFLAEACRVLRVGGRLLMIEPWNTRWSSLIYRRLHHEPFRPDAAEWAFPSVGPLSGANGALPWIVFQRDRALFQREFPQLRPVEVRPFMPIRYLLSGGVSLRSLMPGWSHTAWRGLERSLPVIDRNLAMFALIVVERVSTDGG